MMNTSPVVKMGGWNSYHQSHHLLLSVYYSEKSSDCSVTKRRKNKAFDLVRARSRCEQKKKNLGKTLTQKLHCAVWSLWHCPYCVSPPTSAQSSSQRLTKYRCREKRTGVHPRKMPLYRHKGAGMCNALSWKFSLMCSVCTMCPSKSKSQDLLKVFVGCVESYYIK